MPYEWDDSKRRSNLAKHEIDFEDISGFDWDNALIEPSPRNDELRYVAIGHVGDQLYHVVYTWRGGNRRIISIRTPSRRERRRYERQIRPY